MPTMPNIFGIKPIKLLKGSHCDTGITGQGCFLNIIAYLNGESQITDQSTCVCVTVRPMAIELNDFGDDEQRQRLLPFVMRAMGSATEDVAVWDARKNRLRQYGDECQKIINEWRSKMKAYAHAYANADAYANAYAYAHAYANAYAYACAHACVDAGDLKETLFAAGLRYLDDVLPFAEVPTSPVLERIAKLVEMASV